MTVARGRWECMDRILGNTEGLGDAYWSREAGWLVALCVCWGTCVCHCRGDQQGGGRVGIWIRTCVSYCSSPHSPCKASESPVAPASPFQLLHGLFWRSVDKYLLTPDRPPTAHQNNNSTKVQSAEPMSSLVLLGECGGGALPARVWG